MRRKKVEKSLEFVTFFDSFVYDCANLVLDLDQHQIPPLQMCVSASVMALGNLGEVAAC
jgi:hypothetical protein